MNKWNYGVSVALGRTVLATSALAAGLLTISCSPRACAAPPSQPYNWKQVQIVGGGFVDGIIFDPSVKGLRYARTDIGGAYRWDNKAQRWTPLLDWLGRKDYNLMGVESIAIDPSDSHRVYLACGMYTNATSPNAAILRSDDRGATFQRSDLTFKMGGNEDGRGNGERLAVDPNNGSILYFGSRQAGLWKSTDRAVTWTKVDSFPTYTDTPPVFNGFGGPRPAAPANPAAGNAASTQRPRRPGFGFRYQMVGINGVVFDPRTGIAGKGSSTIYASVSLMDQPNLFRSTDYGVTWQPIANEPTQYRPTHMRLSKDGMLYITYGTSAGPSGMRNGGVWKFDTGHQTWTEITPDKPDPDNGRAFGYAAVSVDAENPQTLIVSTFGHPGGENIFRTTDAGATWKPVFGAGGGTYDFSLAPYVAYTPIHWLFDIEIDPLDPNHAIFTTGYGGYQTFDLTDVDRGKPTKWSVMSKGIEETVALDLVSPPQGAHLVTAIGDYGGFVHWDLDKPTPGSYFTNPRFGNTQGIAFAANDPNVLVRVGRLSNGEKGTNIAYSLDAGKSWSPCPSAPPLPSPPAGAAGGFGYYGYGGGASSSGHIAVSADGKTWVWTPDRNSPFFTRDLGATWTPCQGLAPGAAVVADQADANTFYSLDFGAGNLFVSTDGAATFSPHALNAGSPRVNRTSDNDGQNQLYPTPGKAGDLWMGTGGGLYHSAGGTYTFVKINHVDAVHSLGFGKAAPGKSSPALYLIGTVDGLEGLFRSDDYGASWTRINDDSHQWGHMRIVSGDPRIYGRVYVGLDGRGVAYGDPAPAPAASTDFAPMMPGF